MKNIKHKKFLGILLISCAVLGAYNNACAVNYTVPGTHGTINDAIIDSNNTAAGSNNILLIASDQSITSAINNITTNLTIQGNDSTNLQTIDFNNNGYRFYYNTANGTYSIKDLNLINASNTAVYNASTTAQLDINNVTFSNNTSNAGGAIYNIGKLSITDSTFSNNKATNNGGAIYNYNNGTVNISDGTTFDTNSAAYGGAIYNTGTGSTVTIDGGKFNNNTATSNGGAIYNYSGTVNISGGTIFDTNSANLGGAIYNTGPNGAVTVNDATFTGNTASGSGGAIYNSGTNSIFTVSGSEFNNNIATNHGGAIYNLGADSSVIVDNTTFTGNTATSYGGAVYNMTGKVNISGGSIFDTNSATHGGAVFNTGTINTVTVNDATFTGNTASGSGGAIYNNSGIDSVFTISGSEFNNNTATTHGGAIYNLGADSSVIIDNTTFTGNKATTYGGAISNMSGTIDISNGTIFDTNSADYGGAIFNTGKSSTITIDSGEFNNNTATYFGGAIFNQSQGNVNISNGTIFDTNSANLGGVIFNTETGSIITINGSTFSNNTATSSGGTIYNQNSGTIDISSGTIFDTNSADYGGAIFNIGSGSTITIDSVEFNNNTATIYGGAIFNTGTGSTITIDGSEFNQNTSDTGGAIYNQDYGTVNISNNSIFTGNIAGHGGAIYTNGTINIDNSTFESNSATSGSGGGVIYNDSNGIVKITGSVFKQNISSGHGGVVVNKKTLNVDTSEFDSNTGNHYGGAIHNSGTTSVANITDSVFTNNIVNALSGGAINNEGILTVSGSSFDNNKAITGINNGFGGAIYNTRTATINGNTSFTNNSSNYGGAIANTGTLNLNSTDGDITFTGNTAIIAGNDIYNTGITNINGSANSVIINGGIAGTTAGVINKSNDGSLLLNGNSSAYLGTYNHSGGTAIATAAYFSGQTNISNGNVELAQGVTIPTTANFYLSNTGILDITTNGNLTIAGNITGDGNTTSTINKTGTGELTLTGNDSTFKGAFNQTAGTTTVTSAGTMFGGINTITDSILNVTGVSYYYNTTLGNNGILNHYATTITGGTISSATDLSFIGSGATATFTKDSGLSGNVSYVLVDKIDNGQTNTVAFENADVTLGSNDYTGSTIYSFKDSVLDITTSTTTHRDVEFDNLTSNNTALNFGVSFDINGSNIELNSDTLTVNNSSTGDLKLGIIKVVNDNDNGLSGIHSVKVLEGIDFETTSITYIATTAYEYKTSVDTDKQSIIFEVIQESSAHSLYSMNDLAGERGFNFSFYENTPNIYHIDQSLDTTRDGTFIVQGYDTDATHSVITGKIVDSTGALTGDQGSFFKLEGNGGAGSTDFTLLNLTLEDAYISGNGSVLLITDAGSYATIYNVILQKNESTGDGGAIYSSAGSIGITNNNINNNIAGNNGGAIYNTGTGNISIFNSMLNNNTAGDRGGAIYNSGTGSISISHVLFENNNSLDIGGAISNSGSGEITINNSIFRNNSAIRGGAIDNDGGNLTIGNNTFTNNTAQYGGAISNYAGTTTISGNVLFENNTAVNNGGAISNDGTINIDTSIGNIVFTGNMANNTPNDIHNNSTINITGTKGLYLEGGVSGNSTGVINQNSSGEIILAENSVNHNYSGTYNQTAGTTTVLGNSFFGGTNNITNSKLNLLTKSPGMNINHLALDNAYVNSINNLVTTFNYTNFAVSGITTFNITNFEANGINNFLIDVDGFAGKSDQFHFGTTTGSAVMNVDYFNILTTPTAVVIDLPVFTGDLTGLSFTASQTEVITPIYKYNIDPLGDGVYRLYRNLTSGGDPDPSSFNKQVFRGQVATLATYYNQLAVNNMLFDRIYVDSNELISRGNQNKYAAIDPLFAPYQFRSSEGSLWFKSYAAFETLNFTQDLNVFSTAYGQLVGADFPAVSLKNGWKFLPTTYIAYNGGRQTYDGVTLFQNGGQGGFMGTFTKGGYIGSVLAYGGGYHNEMSLEGFTDTTGNWFAGTAIKNAYNFQPKRNIIIQPTALVSYNIFGKQSWGSDFGAISMNSGYLNGINVAPGLNLIYGRETWSVYLTTQYMFNINDKLNGSAGGVQLPNVRMRHGYIEYGIGATKTWKERFMGYCQIVLRNGGRTGVGFQIGLNWRF